MNERLLILIGAGERVYTAVNADYVEQGQPLGIPGRIKSRFHSNRCYSPV